MVSTGRRKDPTQHVSRVETCTGATPACGGGVMDVCISGVCGHHYAHSWYSVATGSFAVRARVHGSAQTQKRRDLQLPKPKKKTASCGRAGSSDREGRASARSRAPMCAQTLQIYGSGKIAIVESTGLRHSILELVHAVDVRRFDSSALKLFKASRSHLPSSVLLCVPSHVDVGFLGQWLNTCICVDTLG